MIARVEFAAHGESHRGPNTSTVYSEPVVTVVFRTEKPGKLIAIAYCNVHGLWMSEKRLEVE